MNSIYIKCIPQNLVKLILKRQGEIKVQKGIGKYSQSQTVIQILNEYMANEQCNKKNA